MISRLRDAVHAARHRFHQSTAYRVYDAVSGLRHLRANIPDRLLDAYRLEAYDINPVLLQTFLDIKMSGRITLQQVARLNHYGIVLPHQDPGDIQARPSHSRSMGLFQHLPSSYTPYTPDQPGDHL